MKDYKLNGEVETKNQKINLSAVGLVKIGGEIVEEFNNNDFDKVTNITVSFVKKSNPLQTYNSTLLIQGENENGETVKLFI